MQTKVSQYERNCSLNVARGRLTDYNVTSVSTSNAISIFIAVFDGRNTVPVSNVVNGKKQTTEAVFVV